MHGSGHEVFLIWGGNGWIAGLLLEQLQRQGRIVYSTTVRMEDREAVQAELVRVRPTHVLNCAGVTGRPNVDWCEDNKEATIRSNVIGTLNVADCCHQQNIHCTIYATGCIYTYNAAHPMHGGVGFTETDTPNFSGSFYSFTKTHTEQLLCSAYASNTLILRLRMPVSDDLHPRSFVTKISNYERVVDIPNSNTILHDLLPGSIVLALNNEVGVYNFTNPGAISHNEVLTLYERHVRPGFTWRNFSLEEQAKVIKAGRSNCELDASKLVNKMQEYGVDVPEVHVAYERCFQRMEGNTRLGARDRNTTAATSNTATAGISGLAASDRHARRELELEQAKGGTTSTFDGLTRPIAAAVNTDPTRDDRVEACIAFVTNVPYLYNMQASEGRNGSYAEQQQAESYFLTVCVRVKSVMTSYIAR